ncbi:response regulator, partial [Candidatus Kaiserbacteria bacterium]|nr:response regulator [Candidatus Kaiserbacteria bacterium]
MYSIILASILSVAWIESSLSLYQNISPDFALIPPGIALAVFFLYGSRVLFPVALAFSLASFLSPAETPIMIVLTSICVQTGVPLWGAYMLKKMGFTGTFHSLRKVFLFILVTTVTASLATALTVVGHLLAQVPAIDPFIMTSRSWAGYLIGFLVITPLIINWFPWHELSARTLRARFELILALLAVSASSYLIFWISLEEKHSLIFVIPLLVTLFWITLYLNVRKMVLALFLTTFVAISAVLLTPYESVASLYEQLFFTELFLILIVPIFLAFSALLDQHRVASRALEDHVLRLEKAMTEIGAEDAARDEFLATLAHKLRNPLATILSSVELLNMQGKEAKNTSEVLTLVQTEVRTMAMLLNDLLDASHISHSKEQLLNVSKARPSDTREALEVQAYTDLDTPDDGTIVTSLHEMARASIYQLKVLIVDDNAIAADALSQILSLRGYKTEVAYNGEHAFEKALTFRPQVAILDINMPDIDGYKTMGL